MATTDERLDQLERDMTAMRETIAGLAAQTRGIDRDLGDYRREAERDTGEVKGLLRDLAARIDRGQERARTRAWAIGALVAAPVVALVVERVLGG